MNTYLYSRSFHSDLYLSTHMKKFSNVRIDSDSETAFSKNAQILQFDQSYVTYREIRLFDVASVQFSQIGSSSRDTAFFSFFFPSAISDTKVVRICVIHPKTGENSRKTGGSHPIFIHVHIVPVF